jgi:DNA-binding winged helix-turn-helix (wHTH) protein/TolB-like protein
MSQPSGLIHRFGPFQYDPAQRLLFRDGELVPLAPKAIDTLHALLDHRGEVIEKGDLMKWVWPDCVVEEVGLARNISLLRKALGDDAEKFIETIPRRGYRFTADAPPPDAAPPHRAPGRGRMLRWAVGAAAGLGTLVYWQFYRPSRYVPPAAGAATLAVVPFACLDPGAQAFARAFAENLVAEVARFEAVQVISPATVERYRTLGIPVAIMTRMLGLHVMVEGSVQQTGRQRRVTVRLTDVHSGRVIWAEGYDVAAEGAGDPGVGAARAAAAEIGRRLTRR